MEARRFWDGDRFRAAIATALLQALLAYGLIVGLAGGVVPERMREQLTVFGLVPPPPRARPPRRIVPPPRPAGREAGGGSAPNVRSTPTEVRAPPPVLPLPSPVVAAPRPAQGIDPTAGLAPVPGPGSGGGGFGNGTGGGIGNGDGPGEGDGAGGGTPPRHLHGRLRDSDYPRGLGEAGIEGTVSVEYRVELDGRVTGCRVTHSSGSRVLDETTCDLIEQRFRYRPARDRNGRPVVSYIVENHSWIVHDEPSRDED
jgi:protein TonB